jgi:hypothetical protein
VQDAAGNITTAAGDGHLDRGDDEAGESEFATLRTEA